MSYAFIRDIPIGADQYEAVSRDLGPEVPKGLVAHLVVRHDDGLRFIDVWDTEADWVRFRDEKVGPAVRAMRAATGSEQPTGSVPEQRIDLIDVMVGTSS